MESPHTTVYAGNLYEYDHLQLKNGRTTRSKHFVARSGKASLCTTFAPIKFLHYWPNVTLLHALVLVPARRPHSVMWRHVYKLIQWRTLWIYSELITLYPDLFHFQFIVGRDSLDRRFFSNDVASLQWSRVPGIGSLPFLGMLANIYVEIGSNVPFNFVERAQ